MTTSLRDRDRDLIATLDNRLTCISFDQVMRNWWGRTEDPKGSVSRRLRTLAKGHHLRVADVQRREWALAEASLTIASDATDVPVAELRDLVTVRSGARVVRDRIVTSSPGSASRLMSATADEVARELLLAEALLRLKANAPGDAEEWKLTNGLGSYAGTCARLATSPPRYIVIADEYLTEILASVLSACAIDRAILQVW